uniref:2Fe-2S ferredoxin-type domain-containing protein n=1 Tax=Phaeomonas parva TaxID=124430 RepID=A0A7S1XPC9_9STRA|mmetsp:Transcript_21588/g.65952  ORF Transcript_21588/g.65952 Transcript_21588/m.65952 type:complete len:441 (+) Transcript_21588:106-1428(+)
MPSAKTAALAAAALLSATAQALSTGAPGRQVSVRFQNWAPGQSDVVTIASEGEVLMDVGDRVGVKIPRGCKTGICGTCTLDLIDPNYEGTLQTVRACCTIVQGNSEQRDLVVDCSRMGGSEETPSAGSDPMARFSDGWENDFKPDYREEQNDQLYQSVGIGDRRAEADTSMSGADFAVEATGEDEATARMRALLAAQQAVDDDVDVFGGTNYAAGPEMDLPEITPGDFVNFSPDAADAADAPAPQPQPQPPAAAAAKLAFGATGEERPQQPQRRAAPLRGGGGMSASQARREALSRYVKVPEIWNHVQLDTYMRLAKQLRVEIQQYHDDMDLNRAYILCKRFSSLAINCIPKHNAYNASKYRNDKLWLKREAGNSLSLLEDIVRKMEAEELAKRKPPAPAAGGTRVDLSSADSVAAALPTAAGSQLSPPWRDVPKKRPRP